MEESYKGDNRSQLRARLKKEIIQNNIYGVDIEEGAIEIARLRFWLSLVIDLDKPEPLPNFDYKFMQGNSLLESYQFEVESENQNAKPKSVCIDLSGICEKKKVENVNNNGVAIQFEEGDKEREDLMKLLRKYYSETDHAKKKGLREKIEKQVRVLLDAKCSKSYSKYINAMPLICDKFFLWHLWFKDVFDKGGFDIVIGNPPYGATLSDKDKAFFKEHYVTAKTIKEDPKKHIAGQKGSLNTYTLFIELAYNNSCNDGSVSMIVPLSITSSQSVDATHKMIFNNCRDFHVSSYAVRPQPVFKNAVVNVSIISFMKGVGSDSKIYSTKMYRKSKKDEKFSLQNLINNLEFTDVQDHLLIGRVPKIGKEIEKEILRKLKENGVLLGDYIDETNGSPIYYRATGGRYFKVVTDKSTGIEGSKPSTETSLCFNKKYAKCVGCVLSSSLSFWFYQIYSDNLSWNKYEIENFYFPSSIANETISQIEELYERYLSDIDGNKIIHQSKEDSSYRGKKYVEYKIRKSLPIIDEIDDLIGPLYGLTPEEIDFIKNYERTFREDDEDEENENENGGKKRKKKN